MMYESHNILVLWRRFESVIGQNSKSLAKLNLFVGNANDRGRLSSANDKLKRKGQKCRN